MGTGPVAAREPRGAPHSAGAADPGQPQHIRWDAAQVVGAHRVDGAVATRKMQRRYSTAMEVVGHPQDHVLLRLIGRAGQRRFERHVRGNDGLWVIETSTAQKAAWLAAFHAKAAICQNCR